MDEYLIYFVVFLVAAVLLNGVRKGFKSSKLEDKLPPGPRGWPVVGNLVQVLLQKRPFMHIVRDLREKHGPIFTMKMGQRTLVIITSRELMHEALIQKGAAFANRPPDSPIKHILSVGKCTVNTAEYGALWRALRRNMVSELTSPLRVRQCGWIREWAVENHMRQLRAEAAEKGFVEVLSNCRLTICSILICLCFGARLSHQRLKEIESVLKEVMLMGNPKLPDFLPVLTPLFGGLMREAKKVRKKQIESLVPLIRKRQQFVKEGGSTEQQVCKETSADFVQMVSPVGAAYIDSLFELDPPERGHLGDPELVTLASEVIIGGTDTSATILQWAMFNLVQHQDIQEKLYKEIVDTVGQNGTIQESDVEKMVYLGAVVRETLRRHPPTHFTLSHAAVTDTELAGYTIPTGVNVEFYTAWLTADPEVWENPGKFLPERFLTGDGVGVDLTGVKGVKMAPFGVGRRICPAFTLGLLHVHLILARMVHDFKWLPLPGSPPDPTETFAFTVVMKNPLKAIIKPRV
uniref:Cytochrome P450 n=1 Tax=Kalanchoe fedtschenkoi TaxID=63787 RepID=A0A7N0TMR6_KALFE